jgi:hypothetical protein
MFVSRFPSHTLKISCPSENLTFFCCPLITIHPSSYCLFWSQLGEVSNAEDLDREKHYITGVLPCIVPPGDSENFNPRVVREEGGRGQTKGVGEGCSCKYHHQGVDGRIGAVWAGTSAPSLYTVYNLIC